MARELMTPVRCTERETGASLFKDRSLLARRHLPKSDALGPRTAALLAAAERPDMGQPPRAVYSRQRRGDEPGHSQEHRRAAILLFARHSSCCGRRPPDP